MKQIMNNLYIKTAYCCELCNVLVGKYDNNKRLVIQLVSTDAYAARLATLTVNLPQVTLEDDEVAIKDYAENEGMMAFARLNKIVLAPHKYHNNGFIRIPICKLHPFFKELLEKEQV